jgi:arylsulfatase A
LANLTSDIERGRSTDGPTAKNDLSNIRIWKSGRDGTTKK